jgi:methionyl-tRNA formyltransferase
MRIVFVGRSNFMNHCFANWLAERHEVAAFFRADIARYTLQHRLRWMRRRVKRAGLIRTLDQALYTLYYQLLQQRTDRHLKEQAFADRFGRESFDLPAGMPFLEFDDLNGPEALDALAQLQPDLVFAVCISQYLRKPYQEIPRFGTVLYHEGLTPEYRGVHTAFWANARGEAHRIGYTLFRLSGEIDAGEPVAQGVGRIEPRLAKWIGYAGHQALIDGLPDVERALAAIAAGKRIAVKRRPGPAHVFSYAGLSDEIRRIRTARRRRARRRVTLYKRTTR